MTYEFNEKVEDELERARLQTLLVFERECYRQGFHCVAGLDEAGRGPLAGPVVASAVILPVELLVPGLDDSKRLTPKERLVLYPLIFEKALGVGIGVVDHDVIDKINILQATLLAMSEALQDLGVSPDFLLVDALKVPRTDIPQKALIKGDQRSLSIAAASVVAKVTRDRLMQDYHQRFPEYGFLSHKGYPTPEHLRRIRQYGPCAIHRKTFRGVEQPPIPF
ncbi:MAG TPA: ribonuclease HII [Nitrospiria bacterium]